MRAGMAAWLAGMVLLGVLPQLPPTVFLWLCAAGAVVLALLARLLRLSAGRSAVLAATAGLLLAVAYGGLRGQGLIAGHLPEACNRTAVSIEGVVDSLPAALNLAEGARRQRFSFRLEGMWPVHCTGPRKLLLSYYGNADILPGQRWRFSARLKRPWGLANPGSFNVQSWYASSGVQATGSVRGEGELLAFAEGRGIHRLRYQLAGAIARAPLSPRGGAVLRAVTVGDKSGIDHGLWTLCQQLGINHLLVISGLHVAMVAAVGLLLGRLPGFALQLAGWPLAARVAPALSAMAGAFAYSALAGFALPCLRALCMLLVLLLARLLWRRSAAANGLLLAASVLLALQPLAPLGSGFWLSFGAVAGLFWLDTWRNNARGLLRALRVHLLMAGLMLPAGALWFGGASAVAVVANLLLVPLVGGVVVPLSLAGAVLALAGFQEAAQWLWQLGLWPLEQALALGATAAAAQNLYLQLSGGSLAALLALLAIVLAVLPLGGVWRAATALLLLPLVFPARVLPAGPALHVLDVGQGSAVVYSAGGRTLLYDTGGGNPAGASLAQSVVLPWLRVHGVRELDDFVLSHGDYDHSGGAADVLQSLAVGRLWTGGGVAALADARACRAGQAWTWPDGSRFRFLSPLARTAASDNDSSCVLLIEARGMRVLLPGDIGQQQERALIRAWGKALKSDVLLVGHHGSITSTAQSWLNHVDPGLAVIGAGYASRFGHPHPVVLRRLQAQGITLHQTAREGALSIQPDGRGKLQLQAWREQWKTWWK